MSIYDNTLLSPSSLPKGFDLDLTFPERKSNNNMKGIQEESILIVFDLPDAAALS